MSLKLGSLSGFSRSKVGAGDVGAVESSLLVESLLSSIVVLWGCNY